MMHTEVATVGGRCRSIQKSKGGCGLSRSVGAVNCLFTSLIHLILRYCGGKQAGKQSSSASSCPHGGVSVCSRVRRSDAMVPWYWPAGLREQEKVHS